MNKIIGLAKKVGISISAIDKLSNRFGNGFVLLENLLNQKNKPDEVFEIDGKVAAICSDSYGISWAVGRFDDPEIQKKAIFDPKLVRLIQDSIGHPEEGFEPDDRELKAYVKQEYGVENPPKFYLEFFPRGVNLFPHISPLNGVEHFIFSENSVCYNI